MTLVSWAGNAWSSSKVHLSPRSDTRVCRPRSLEAQSCWHRGLGMKLGGWTCRHKGLKHSRAAHKDRSDNLR